MTLASIAAQDPLSGSAFIYLLAALGLSSTAGLRAYIPLFAVGLAGSANVLPLQESFKPLSSPIVLVILALLAVGEFILDKVPIIDHVNDAIHTLIRPVSGALIMAGTQNSLSDWHGWAAAAVGAMLALVFHGAKATARPAVSATTIGHGNPIVSLIEDVLVILAVLVLIFAPVVGIILVVALAGLFGRFVLWSTRWMRRRKKNGPGAVPPGPGAVSMPPMSYTPTVAGSNPPGYPAYTPPANPVQPPATLAMPLTPTQPYPPMWQSPQQGGGYPPDAPTIQGSH